MKRRSVLTQILGRRQARIERLPKKKREEALVKTESGPAPSALLPEKAGREPEIFEGNDEALVDSLQSM